MRTLLIILALFYAATVTAEDKTNTNDKEVTWLKILAIESRLAVLEKTTRDLQVLNENCISQIIKLKIRNESLVQEILALKATQQYGNTDDLNKLNDQLEQDYQREIAEINRFYAEQEAQDEVYYQQRLHDIELDSLQRRLRQLEQNQQY